jgi:uncharacterized membrane protein (DUF485 family)
MKSSCTINNEVFFIFKYFKLILLCAFQPIPGGVLFDTQIAPSLARGSLFKVVPVLQSFVMIQIDLDSLFAVVATS